MSQTRAGARGAVHLADFSSLAEQLRERVSGLPEFLRHDLVADLQWPADVVEQWLFDHAGYEPFLVDYGHLDLGGLEWHIEEVPTADLEAIQTGASDAGALELHAANPEHWITVRRGGAHEGVAFMWEMHGTWKRLPLLLDRSLLDAEQSNTLQLIEGRTRVGVLQGRLRTGAHVASSHLAWVARRRRRELGTSPRTRAAAGRAMPLGCRSCSNAPTTW